MVRTALTCLMVSTAGAAEAARVEALEVGHQDGVYSVRAEAWLDAPPAAVHAALIDFPRLTRLSPAVRQSRVMGETRDGTLVFTRTRACAGWFCRDLRQTQLVTVTDELITAVALPEQSNVEVGHTTWQVRAEGEGTHLAWTTVVDPAFFVPPLLGPPLVKSALRRESEQFASGVERVARGEWQEPVAPKRKPRRPRGAGPEPAPDDGR
jgi:carbon monoxide dehydrogenase subunit G